MKKKLILAPRRWIGLAVLSVGVWVLWVMAFDLHLDLKTQSLSNHFSAIHFNAGGNDFGGWAFWVSTKKKLTNPVIIQWKNWDTRECTNQIQWYYYNSQRWERLWPFDEESLEFLKGSNEYYQYVQVTWGLYTNCSGAGGDRSDIYGKVNHEVRIFSGSVEWLVESHELIAGLSYDYSTNEILPDWRLACSLQLINNKTVVGYLYDKTGGIGFVGGKITDEDLREDFVTNLQATCVSEYCSMEPSGEIKCTVPGHGERYVDNERSFQNLKRNIAVRGVVGLTKDILGEDRENIEGNFWAKTQTVNTDAISIANVINRAAINAEALCRNSWITDWNQYSAAKKIICYDGNVTGVPLVFDNFSSLLDKTLVVKWVDVFFLNYMKHWDKPISVFIDKGNLVLQDKENESDLSMFDDNGYVQVVDSTKVVNKGNYLKGTFIVNGLILGKNDVTGTYDHHRNKLYVQGKLMSLNTYDEPTPARKAMVKSLLSLDDSYMHFINFRDVFQRRCGDNGTGTTDGTDCSRGLSEFARAPLSLIDENYDSPLLR